MLDKVITSLSPKYENLNNRLVLLWLFVISILIRFPFFFRDYIDRDESTFILVAQSWVDGHLPYTELWDLKPPMVYLFFAGILYFFGKSFIAIRLVGAIGVAITAFFTYKIGKDLKSARLGLWSAVSCVYLLSLFGSLQGVMSEHLSMLLFMPALYILIRYDTIRWFFLSGLLLGVSLMMKLNLAYAVMIMGIFFLVQSIRRKQIVSGIWKLIALGSGIALIIGFSFIPYFLEGIAKVWYNSVILAPLEYASMNRSSFIKLLPICILTGAFFIICWKKKWLDYKNPKVLLLVLVVLGVIISFLKSGKVNGHYLMQVYPMLLILIGLALTHAPRIHKRFYGLVVLFALLLPVESYREYYAIFKNKVERGTFYNGEGFTVPKFLKENQLDTENILFFEYHIGYWVLGATPPTKATTHPSNICRDNLFPFYDNPRKTPMEELRFLLDIIKPGTVIIRSNKTVFDKKFVVEDHYVRDYLKRYYQFAGTVDRAEVYSRSQGH
jgi:hypothetical protein